ncbi:hypothetical protein GBF35_46200 [Nonomuraea phyllanthi]|uniref:hypothetical protein n=1 Tax=Nonomuraea phyllanthi TaxID=2219224 RepID=UPI001293746F|nr:hypothetical protein [Nonomuraea phyllanthi]QFY12975.1 hypothetical protein GBF35_46200 [Nonomuraea phyllanthi]
MAVRIAVKLARHTVAPDKEAIREAATRLPTGLRERLAAAFGTLNDADPKLLTTTPLPALAPPIESVAELAAELDAGA